MIFHNHMAEPLKTSTTQITSTLSPAKSVVNNIAGYKRFSRLKSIKLSSGLTVPTEVDTRILPDLENLPGSSHPLNLSGYGTS